MDAIVPFLFSRVSVQNDSQNLAQIIVLLFFQSDSITFPLFIMQVLMTKETKIFSFILSLSNFYKLLSHFSRKY